MTLGSSLVVAASCVGGLLLAAGTARAITLPDSGSCAVGGVCLSISNNGNGSGFRSQVGDGIAVIAVSGSGSSVTATAGSGSGVLASSNSGSGVFAISQTSNAVLAQNSDTTMAAAAVSALAGSSSGLAYYGTGNIIISGSLAQKAGGGSWTAPSDIRIKKDVTPLRLGLDQLRQIRPVTYKYNGLGGTTDDGQEYVGVVAQELEKIFPKMVTSRKGKLHPSDTAETDIKVVDPSALTYVLINSVKEQQQIIDRQERRIAALERGRGVSASMLSNGAEMALAFGLLPLGFVALRRRKESKSAQ